MKLIVIYYLCKPSMLSVFYFVFLTVFLLNPVTSNASKDECVAVIIGLKGVALQGSGKLMYMFFMIDAEDNKKSCRKYSESVLSIGNVEDFCRSTRQCDFVESYATTVVRNYGVDAGKAYAERLKQAWARCDAKYGRCYYLSRSYLQDHELK